MIYSVHPSIAYAHAIVQNLKAKTGRDLDEWTALLDREGPGTETDRRSWLKKEHGLGQTTASLIAERSLGKGLESTDVDVYMAEVPNYLAGMFQGKEVFVPAYERILEAARQRFPELKVCPCQTIVPLYRNHVFAQVRPATKSRLELGLSLKGYAGDIPARLVDTGGLQKGDRITHKFHLAPGDLPDEEMLHWLNVAYELDKK